MTKFFKVTIIFHVLFIEYGVEQIRREFRSTILSIGAGFRIEKGINQDG